jgi:hypothetical protein
MRGRAIIHSNVLYIFDGNPDAFDTWQNRLLEVACKFTVVGFDDAEGIVKLIANHTKQVISRQHEEDPDAESPVISYY